MKPNQPRKSVRRSEIDRVVQVLRQNGIQPTGAEILPDGTVKILSEETGSRSRTDDTLFDAWWAEHGQKT